MIRIAQLQSYFYHSTTTFQIQAKHVCGTLALNMSSKKRNNHSAITNKPLKNHRLNCEKNQSIVQIMSSKSSISPIEVMEPPNKSEYDKKSYRVIRLANGLNALLVSDPTSKPNDLNECLDGKALEESITTSDDEGDTDGDESGEDESDDEGRENDRGKLAACALCVDVGSFSDPRNIQGLAHFLGEC